MAGRRCSVQLLGEDWELRLGLDGLTMRSQSGLEYRFSSADVMDAHQVLESYRRSGLSGLESPNRVPQERLGDWLRVYGLATVLSGLGFVSGSDRSDVSGEGGS